MLPDSDWTKAAQKYNMTAIPTIVTTSHTVSRELEKDSNSSRKDPIHCWFHDINGFATRWSESTGNIKQASQTSLSSKKPRRRGHLSSLNALAS